MKKIYVRLKTFFNTIQGKIAFYPTVMAFVGFILAFGMAWLEESKVSRVLLERAPQLMLEDGDTVLTIMSACIGGIISMMVFSFSMVMLLLSQASSNFSPRLLPGLISDKKNQLILGAYLSTIIYLVFTLFSIEPDDEKYTLPGLSILLGILATFACLGAFVYFIHNMSQSIQINNILDKIYDKSKRRLHLIIDKEQEKDQDVVNSFPDTKNWFEYSAKSSGYFQNISLKNVVTIALENETRLYFTIPKGFFVLKNKPFIKSEKKLDEETVNKLLSDINFARGEFVEDNYILAFKQITEIAVKAMSPGVNDPGTAINAIDYLTELFALRIQKSDSGIIAKDGKALVKIATVNFDDLLYNNMASLRTYCKHDPIIVEKLISMLDYLYHMQDYYTKDYKEAIKSEMELLVEDAKSAMANKKDWTRIERLVQG
ncbi:DUF2254 domain-containing protein [Marinirhabdus gelatinilytica]|uniref:Putative membrane protein n=1 Tax=Marinirhabdus gelatinilytica TaxID=1703343 RepID=A0A370QAZ7_9FLAO|nr:DUF2254 domain-containing protein [Marinirhabdus gelatinilytica]RDK85543.1 putative membrane protein [Marinirhabdus gelatinilytica]